MRFFLLFILALLAFSCKTEEEAGPSNKGTFLRFFGSEFSHSAIQVMEANNGFTMLSNIDIPTNDLGAFMYKSRVIRTDQFGNIEWQAEFPSYDEKPVIDDGIGGFKASSFIQVEGGYLLVGERIYSPGNSALELLKIDGSGNVIDSLVVPGAEIDPNLSDSATPAISGRAVTVYSNGNFIVLASVTGLAPKDMMVAEIDQTLEQVLWHRTYGDGITTIVNRVFCYPSEILWGGTYRQNSETQPDFRIVQTPPKIGSEYAPTFGLPELNETASDMCEALGGYAFIGTSQSGNADKDIIIRSVSKSGVILHTSQINFDNTEDGRFRNDDLGNAVSTTKNGRLIALGTVRTTPTKGNGGTDFFLMKLSAAGQPEWENGGIHLGGPNDEEGASVIETEDGSYLIFGTTTFGKLKKLVLMKVNNKGEL